MWKELRKFNVSSFAKFIHKNLRGKICVALSWASVENRYFHGNSFGTIRGIFLGKLRISTGNFGPYSPSMSQVS